MTERSVPASVRADLERSSGVDALIWFLTVTHPSLSAPLRLVSDVFDYVVDGETYTGVVFGGRAVSDGDNPPYAELRVPNVDRRIGAALRTATGPARVEAVVRTTADFDLSVVPREPVGTPATIYAFSQFRLTNIEVTAAEVVGRLSLVDYSQEPWPWIRATADRFPGLFA